MSRLFTMLAVTALLCLFVLEKNAVEPKASLPLSGVAGILSMDDSPRLTHP